MRSILRFINSLKHLNSFEIWANLHKAAEDTHVLHVTTHFGCLVRMPASAVSRTHYKYTLTYVHNSSSWWEAEAGGRMRSLSVCCKSLSLGCEMRHHLRSNKGSKSTTKNKIHK